MQTTSKITIASIGPSVDLHIPGTIAGENKRRQFGNLILSRYPIAFSRHHLLPKYGSIGPLSIQRSAIETTIRTGKQLLRVYSVHLTHLSSETRLPQIDRLLEINQNAFHEGYPVQGKLSGTDWEDGICSQDVATDALIFGDFNFQPASVEYNKIVGPLSDYGGHVISPTSFVDAWTQCGHDKFQGYTSDVNDEPARLDYCFASTTIANTIKSCRVDTDASGSDHLPLWVDLKF